MGMASILEVVPGQSPVNDPWKVPRAARTQVQNQMADEITRPELDAKLELIETRMDGRMQTIEHHISTMLDVSRRSSEEAKESRKEVRNWGIGVIATVITMTITVILGVWQIVTGLSQTNAAMFESGRNIGAMATATPPKVEEKKK